MAQRTLPERVELLEKMMEEHQSLPPRVEALASRSDTFELQFLQFRTEVKEEFSATRAEIEALRQGQDSLRQSVESLQQNVESLRQGQESLRQSQEGLATRSEMRTLHEHVMERIAWLGEGMPASTRKRKRKA